MFRSGWWWSPMENVQHGMPWVGTPLDFLIRDDLGEPLRLRVEAFSPMAKVDNLARVMGPHGVGVGVGASESGDRPRETTVQDGDDYGVSQSFLLVLICDESPTGPSEDR
ncbi:hypothetical protein N7478_004877 [Penicillium angulare]|uniref:uncharacterized protein n=1 Tax=Penicillium angulare TaxID=116970 RepID=UPI002541AB7C|nr:uncharacterized protein N7478_004877 [Penicillium angulare]KAJ5279505.1 hypothetical protein N7478_004877 [Penicillium angulare]